MKQEKELVPGPACPKCGKRGLGWRLGNSLTFVYKETKCDHTKIGFKMTKEDAKRLGFDEVM